MSGGKLRQELVSLAMFLAVAEERSFTRAAAKLGVSQSTEGIARGRGVLTALVVVWACA